MFETEPASKRL